MKCHSCFENYKKKELNLYSSKYYCTECLKGILDSQGVDFNKLLNENKLNELKRKDSIKYLIAGFITFTFYGFSSIILYVYLLNKPKDITTYKLVSDFLFVLYIGFVGSYLASLYYKFQKYIFIKNLYLQAIVFFIPINLFFVSILVNEIKINMINLFFISTILTILGSLLFTWIYLKTGEIQKNKINN